MNTDIKQLLQEIQNIFNKEKQENYLLIYGSKTLNHRITHLSNVNFRFTSIGIEALEYIPEGEPQIIEAWQILRKHERNKDDIRKSV